MTKAKRQIVFGVTMALIMSIILIGCGGKSVEPPSSNNGVEPPSTGDTVRDTVGDQVGYEIIGIDPGAGIMAATRSVLEEYQLSQWRLVESSEAAMIAELKRAYSNQEPIIITGWSPHWKFSSFDLKYLDDPQNIYGGEEQIHTLVRLGLQEDHPSAYQVLDNFYWQPSDMEAIMVMIEEGMGEEEAVASWIANNMDIVNEWIAGVDEVDGDRISLAYVAWATEIASTNVVASVLEYIGYQVTLQQLEPGGMFAGVAGGSSDALVAAWMPTTHEAFYDRFAGDFEDLGPNLDGTRIGLVVPSYMDIDSIEDLR